LGVKEIYGKHIGENLANYVLNVLRSFGIEEKLFCVTADNASNNYTMAKCLEISLAQFQADQNLLGCIGHVINLAAKATLKVLELEKLNEFESAFEVRIFYRYFPFSMMFDFKMSTCRKHRMTG
jgi:hypothetical protein